MGVTETGVTETGVTHELKCWPEYFMAIWERRKTFEIRKNDRDFQVGDKLSLREWDPSMPKHYTGAFTTRTVTYVTDFPYGLRDGYVCMGLT